MAQGYASPGDVIMLLRIASVVRLAAATTISCLAGIVSSGVSLAFRHWFGQMPPDTLTCLVVFSVTCRIAIYFLDRTSKKYAESFWRNLASGIIVQTTAK